MKNSTVTPKALVARFHRYQHSRLRIGYLSGDFHTHAVACHMVGLFEHHDPTVVECFAFSTGPRVETDVYRQRIKRAFEHWHDLNDLSDEDAATLIARHEIDVLVDLSGTTMGGRLGILKRHPSPFVLHYLGYPGTIAHPAIDFLVADSTVIPPEHEHLYAERIIRMPTCYQVNDASREHPARKERIELGLPQNAIVMSNFNRESKWSERFMNIWLTALAYERQAVLWLVDPGSRGRDEVLSRARVYGVEAQIVWAPRVPMSEHLARLGVADLALDQLPYSSHATGANALWMGVPLLTCLGQMFHGRVGASLVRAAELPEFVTDSEGEYSQRLQELLATPERLFSAKQHLTARRLTLPLFDTARFTKDWERLLHEIVNAA